MKYFLSDDCVLKGLETPSVYHIPKDELYELDDDGFIFLLSCASGDGCEGREKEFIDFCLSEGILTDIPIKRKRPKPVIQEFPTLRYLELQITDRCNLKCGHCYIGKGKGRELSPGTVGKILSEFEEMQGLRVLITGGEPLLHGNFREINSVLDDFALRKVLFTNGTLLNKTVLKSLKVEEIQISIDGLERAHDSVRGRGAYKKALAAMQMAIDTGFQVSVSTMIHRENLNEFDGMNDLFRRLGVKDWTVDVPCFSGNLRDNPAIMVTPEEASGLMSYGFGEGLHGGGVGYGCGLHLMSVLADGSCAKCAFFAEELVGHIGEGLSVCWRRIEPVRLDDTDCDCEYVNFCRGGCRYRALVQGSIRGKDFYRCALYDKIKKKEVNP